MISATVVAILAFAVAGIFVFTAWTIARRDRRRWLRRHFGPEYDAAVQTHSTRTSADEELARRADRMQGVPIRPLRPEEKEIFASRWHDLQARFVDDPPGAVQDADVLVCEAMRTRGYPAGDFEVRAGNLSVDHPGIVQNYRAGHEIATRSGVAAPGIEDLRRALFYYRAVYEELVELQGVR